MQLLPPTYVDAAANQESYWQWQVLDVNPGSLQLHQPLISVEVSDDGEHFTTLLDDQGVDLQIIHDGPSDGGMSRYYLRWYNPEIAVPGRWFRFRLEPRNGQDRFFSSVFR